MQQFEHRKNYDQQIYSSDYENPKVAYEFYFKLFGLVSAGMDSYQRAGPIKQDVSGQKLRRVYCQLISTLLWFFAIRSFVLMFIWDPQLQLMMGDITGLWNDYRMYYLMPMLYFSLQTAITSSSFLSKERDLTWLVPFISVKQMQMNGHRSHYYNIKKYTVRITIGIFVSICFVVALTGVVSYQYYITARTKMTDEEFFYWLPWLIIHCLWIFYVAGITAFPLAYFNLVAVVFTKRFAQVCREIEDLADSDPGPPGSKNAALTTLYYEHNEVCELVDESNMFWQTYTFFTYITYIPCNCYVLYNLFFAKFDEILGPFTWGTFFFTIIFLAILSVSAADVAAEAHAPYTALHTLSLLQLPIDLEVNMSTFLHRVRGPTIGYSCLDLFVLTNASISNTIAAVASYFLIVADFSRSTVGRQTQTTAAPPTVSAVPDLVANLTTTAMSLMSSETTGSI
ncbi:Gustatory receptor-like protein [Dinothrombium tinctorium]|uniref:Gustatory receptor-like protein n=1 Tax=Dinothrombium tinctorium TaxID=1965070 RepID=A0A3S3PAV5_9ACAR|nr:Gustatory receptor-like protein [Dinothrombium tinctorium]RWS15886.1 Gustatory receptor-like protein [Dinothrombium tinctorium]